MLSCNWQVQVVVVDDEQSKMKEDYGRQKSSKAIIGVTGSQAAPTRDASQSERQGAVSHYNETSSLARRGTKQQNKKYLKGLHSSNL